MLMITTLHAMHASEHMPLTCTSLHMPCCCTGPGAPGAPSSTGGGFDSTGPSAGRGRGFAVGRGRGIRPPYPGAPGAGAERWALSGAGGHVSSATGSGRSYSPQELKRVHDHLVAVHGPNLPLPDGVNMPDYTGLLPEGEGDGYSGEGHHPYRPFGAANADRAGRWLAGERTASGRLDDGPHGGAPSQAPTTVSPAAFAADRWVYRDPQGDVQGPFTKVDILDWFEAGFFPQDLPIKSEVDPPEVPFVPLATMLKMWAAIGSGRAPPGFVPPSAAHAAPQQQHQQHQPQQQDAPNPGRSLLEALGKQLQEPGTPQHYAGGRPPAPPQQGPGLMSPLDQVLGLGGPRPLMQQPGGQPGLGMGMGGGLWGAGGPGGLLGGPGANGGAGGAGLLGSAWQRGPGEMGDAGPSYRPLGGGLLGPQPHGQPPQGGPVLGGGMWGFQPAPPPDAPQHDGWGAAQPPQPPPQQQPPASQQQQPQPPHPQQQQQQPSPAAPWAQQGAAGSGQKSLAEIQREQASEAARHGGQAPPPPAPAEAVQDKPATPKGLEGLHPNLQQLFVAVQRAQTQGQAPGQAPAAPAQPAAAAAPAAPAPAAAAPNQKAKKGKDEGKPEPAEQPAAPAEPAPPVKVAPWAAASAKAATGKTLREIQEEEAARAAEEAARAAAHDAQAAAAPAPAATAAPSPWARIAAANAGVVSPPGPWGNTAAAAAAAAAAAPAAARPVPLSAIMSKEMEDSKARAAAASSSPPVGTGPGPRGSTIAELMEKIINPSPAAKATAWGGAATRAPAAPSLRDVMFEESAADLEGGAMDEDLSDLLPPQPARPAPAAPVSTWVPPAPAQAKTLREIQEEEERRARAARQAAAPPPPAAKPAGDDDLFWDYDAPSGAAAPPPPPPPPAAPAPKPAVTLANIAAKNMPAPAPPAARPAAPAPAAKPSAWAAAAGPSKAVTAAPTVQQPAASVARANGVAAGAARPAAAARPAESAALASSSAGASASSGAPLVFGDLVLSSDFRDWCAREMVKFFDSPDLSLIEFLMTLASRSEVAEYCAMYMSGKQGVSTFVAEFLKRKDAEVAKASNPGKKKGKAAAAAPAPVTAASVVKAAVAAPPLPKPPAGGAIPGDDWQQIPGATAATKGGAKAQPKGGAKGAAGAKKGGFAVLGGL